MKELQEIAQRLTTAAEHSVLATLVDVQGSSYRRPGARLLVLGDGSRYGSISGGCLEEDLLGRMERVGKTQVAEIVGYDTTSENDLVWGVGLGCHGIVRILVEPVPPKPPWALALAANFLARRPTMLTVIHDRPDSSELGTRLSADDASAHPGAYVQVVNPPVALVIFGAGDDAKPLATLAREVGWAVTVADPRSAFATSARFPHAAVVTGPVDDLMRRTRLDERTAAVIMTHHYVHDRPLLPAVLASPAAYIGLLGPRKRAEKILADIATEGFHPSPEQRARLHAPTGLDIGADGPEQVALSIVAEIQAVVARRDARPLRDRVLPIHAPLSSNP